MNDIIKIINIEEINSTMFKVELSCDINKILLISDTSDYENNYEKYRISISEDKYFEPLCYLNSDNSLIVKVNERIKSKTINGTTFVHKDRINDLNNIINNFNNKFGYKEI